MRCLFSSNIRKLLITAAILGGLLCLTLVRYSGTGSLQTASLYAMLACIMALVVLYKNSLAKYEIAFFIFLMIQLLAVMPKVENMESHSAISYLLSYRYGVSSRGFSGTIVDFLAGGGQGFISRSFIWHFIVVKTVLLSFVIAEFLGTLIHRVKGDTKYFLIFLSLLWLTCFTTPAVYFHQLNFGRNEVLPLIILFLMMLIIKKPVVRWIIPILALFIIASHLILVFFYIPFVAMLLLYGIAEKGGTDKRGILLLGTTVTVLFAAFISYILFAKETFVFETPNAFIESLQLKTDLTLEEWSVHYSLFASFGDHLAGWKDRVFSDGFFRGNLSILVNIPLLSLFIALWIQCFAKETEKIKKLFFIVPILVLPFHALAFFMFFDFGRWMIMILNVQFLLIFYLIKERNKTVLSVVHMVTPFIKRNAFLIALLMLTMIFLGPFDHLQPSDKVMRFYYFLVGR